MSQQSKQNNSEKQSLHPRNRHRTRYDFEQLIKSSPELARFVTENKFNNLSIDFADPLAVKTLNKALLKTFYAIMDWDIPANYLCPPIPGRADYIHYMADLLASSNKGVIPQGASIKALDIGVGANCVYPIIGNYEYGWSFTGSDADPVAVSNANKIINANHQLAKAIDIRLQANANHIFKGIIQPGEFFDITICNPPFHSSFAEAQEGTSRKQRNLGTNKNNKTVLNFGGQNGELWCKGGEREFVSNMIRESTMLQKNCCWFSSLVSKSANLESIYYALKQVNAAEVKTISMAQGSKISRIVAWTFLTKTELEEWRLKRWSNLPV